MLASSILVPNKNGIWQVCVDSTNQNKACPKDSSPLLHIYQLIDSTTSHEQYNEIFGASKSKLPEVLPRVLRDYRTTTNIRTGETSFSLI